MAIQALRDSSPTASPAGESKKLIRCHAVNPFGETMVRFVDLEYFSLWEYMMTTRHDYRVTDYALCLWVPENEYERAPQVYSHGRDVEAVERFDIAIFDEVHHYTYRVSRYAPASEAATFRKALLSHVPDAVRASDRFTLEQAPGYCVYTEHTREADHFVLGLYSALQY